MNPVRSLARGKAASPEDPGGATSNGMNLDYLKQKLEQELNLKHLVILNILFFVALKLFIPLSFSQFADILNPIAPFDSRAIISETNKARAENGLAPLKANAKLDVAAYNKMQDMIKSGYFAHVSPSGVNPWFWFSGAGYNYHYAGENLALGYATPEDTVRAWLNSPSHRANVLNVNYDEIGVAVGTANINGINGILVVQDFGKQFAIAPVAKTISKKSVAQKPAPTKSAATVPVATVSGAEAARQISTDTAVPAASNVTTKKINTDEAIRKTQDWLTGSFAVYLALFMGVLMIMGMVIGFKPSYAVAAGVNFALLLLLFLLPPIQFLSQVSIF